MSLRIRLPNFHGALLEAGCSAEKARAAIDEVADWTEARWRASPLATRWIDRHPGLAVFAAFALGGLLVVVAIPAGLWFLHWLPPIAAMR